LNKQDVLKAVKVKNFEEELKAFASQGLSLLVKKEGRILFTSYDKKLKPVLQAIATLGNSLHGATVVDKMVGGGVAKLFVYAQVKEVFTLLASKPAIEILENTDISLKTLQVTDCIRDERGKCCDMEILALQVTDPAAFYARAVQQLYSEQGRDQATLKRR